VQKNIPVAKIVFFLLGLVVLGYFVLSGFSDQKSSFAPDKKFILLSFDDFHNLIGGRDRLPTDQKKAILNQYRGRCVRWSGEVYEIVKGISGDFLLRVQHGAGFRNFDVTVRFHQSKAEKLKKLNSGEAVSYRGKLVSFDPDSGFYLEDGGFE